MENHETQSNPVRGAFASAEELASCASDGRSKARGAVRRFFVWTFLTAKRLLKKPSFVLILLMLPAVILLYRALITENDGKLHVAVWFEEHDELSKHFLSEMTEKVPEQFLFYECEDEEDLYSDVAAGRAECGYVFSADMAGKILTDEWRGMITAVVSERTVYGEFVNEIVYDKLNRVLSFKVVSDYLVNRSDIDGMDAAPSLNHALGALAEDERSPLFGITRRAVREFNRINATGDAARLLNDNVRRALHFGIAEEMRRLRSSLSMLATTSNTAPFIGLFGTVWGIMHAFHAIGAMKSVSLATVAPGIAEALIATAMGLFVAIPATCGYNLFSSRLAVMEGMFVNFGGQLLNRMQHEAEAHPQGLGFAGER